MANLKMEIKPTDALYVRPADSSIYQKAEGFLIGMGEGRGSKLYKKIMHSGVNCANATGSSPLLNMAIQRVLPDNQRVASLDDMIKMLKEDPTCFSGIYSDTTEIILYSPTPSREENTQIIKSLTGMADSKEYNCENPLRFTGLTITRDTNSQNPYGVMFKFTSSTKIQNDPRFAYSNSGEKVDFNGVNVNIYTKENGLSGLCAGDGVLFAWNGDLAYSNGGGRVVVADAEGVDFKK